MTAPSERRSQLEAIFDRIAERSRPTRDAYLRQIDAQRRKGPNREAASCANLAHAYAACPEGDKAKLSGEKRANIAIVTAYNDMLSAHQPLAGYPDLVKEGARREGATAQVAGGVPAMCDGVTQGREGMELSLLSRDVIAMGTAVALSHDVFDGAVCLGVCDKIVPGLVIGALAFGHLPFLFAPAGPMPSGLSNEEKAKTRQRRASGEIGEQELLQSEMAAYHAPGTCTFYGTANSNQMLMEIMGLHLPGASFENPGTPIRDALTIEAGAQAARITALGDDYRPAGVMLDERAFVHALVGLMATGGSTNHTLHLIAMARAAGIVLRWEDFAALSAITPLLTRIYPNGLADVNHFHQAGGMGFLIGQLLEAGLLFEDAKTSWGGGLADYAQCPSLDGGALSWRPARAESGDPAILAPASQPFQATGGLALLEGELGRSVIKVSAVKEKNRLVEAPARVFHDQADLIQAFSDGLDEDFVAVVRFQGPKANGMPELHRLTPILGLLQDKGRKVALVTDGRMSGASGKVPAAIHVTPEAAAGGPIGKVKDGDPIRLDADRGELRVLVDPGEWAGRGQAQADLSGNDVGCGRDLFKRLRPMIDEAEEGASLFDMAGS